jgi:hypothetical protein
MAGGAGQEIAVRQPDVVEQLLPLSGSRGTPRGRGAIGSPLEEIAEGSRESGIDCACSPSDAASRVQTAAAVRVRIGAPFAPPTVQ